MKIQSLAVIFVIIILPISIVLSEYLQAQIETVNLQSSYDSRLIGATYDAVKAYQLNSRNSTTRELTSTKIRDIEASANTFFTSIANNFGESDSGKGTVQGYVPAIVYCLYDGYYIYTPYKNDIDGIDIQQPNADYQDKQQLNGVKPYIYYSCRYIRGSDDFVITYSLDNFIAIQGKVNGKFVNDSGYVLDGIKVLGDNNVTYNDVPISSQETLKENVYDPDLQRVVKYDCARVDGTKYYIDQEGKVFYIQQDGTKNYSPDRDQKNHDYYYNRIEQNQTALNFYKNAYSFTQKVRGTGPDDYNLGNLKFSDSVDADGTRNSIGQLQGFNTEDKIFDANVKAQDTNSNFTEHRTAIIRYSIQKNLTTAIANYNRNFNSAASFEMPNLSETDWYKIINNISVISFLQGLPIGGKIYNGYVVVNNNKNDDFVSEDSIYITTNDAQYHRYNDSDLKGKSGYMGYLNTSFERYTSDEKNYYYPHDETGCYTSIVNQSTVYDYKSDANYGENGLLKYLLNTGGQPLATAYYTALGREKSGMYRSANIDEIVDKNTD